MSTQSGSRNGAHVGAFSEWARHAAEWMGTPWAFAAACATILVWLLAGPFFAFSDTWQLIINTGTTIVTFLMVFLIQNTQNRDARALHLKLDEIINASKHARNKLIDLEHSTDEELDELQSQFEDIKNGSGLRAGSAQATRRGGAR